MPFNIIGKSADKVLRGGVITPNEIAANENGVRFPTAGLINYCPFTSDINDVVGSLSLTNNNGVSFSEAGALCDESSKAYLSATVTWPTVFTWCVQTKPLAEQGPLVMGCGSATGTYLFTAEQVYPTSSKQVMLAYIKDSSGGSASGAAKLASGQSFDFSDGAYHTMAVLGSKAGGVAASLWIDGRLISVGMPYPAVNISTSFAIGRSGAGDWGYADAYWRHFRVYDRHLTPHELLYLR